MKTTQKTSILAQGPSNNLRKNKIQQTLKQILSNFQEISDSNRNQIYTKLGDNVRQSEQTEQTNQTLHKELQDCMFDEKTLSLHDFTFYPSEIQNLSFQHTIPVNKKKQKYANQSLECVIYYALLCNHLHLQEINQNLSLLKSISLNCYKIIKKYMLNYDEIIAKRHLKDYIFPKSSFRLIQNKSCSLRNRKQWLKDLLDKIDASIASQIVEQTCKEACRKMNAKNLLNRRENDTLIKIHQFAGFLGIRIKYESQFKLLTLGKKDSCISIWIVETQDKFFQLKKINNYQ